METIVLSFTSCPVNDKTLQLQKQIFEKNSHSLKKLGFMFERAPGDAHYQINLHQQQNQYSQTLYTIRAMNKLQELQLKICNFSDIVEKQARKDFLDMLFKLYYKSDVFSYLKKLEFYIDIDEQHDWNDNPKLMYLLVQLKNIRQLKIRYNHGHYEKEQNETNHSDEYFHAYEKLLQNVADTMPFLAELDACKYPRQRLDGQNLVLTKRINDKLNKIEKYKPLFYILPLIHQKTKNIITRADIMMELLDFINFKQKLDYKSYFYGIQLALKERDENSFSSYRFGYF